MGQTSLRTNIEMVYHFGAPFTENSQLVLSLEKNTDLLKNFGILALRPKSFKSVFLGMLTDLEGSPSTLEDQRELLDDLTGDRSVDRLVMCNSNILGQPAWVLAGQQLYRNGPSNCRKYRELLPANPCEFFIGISNPAIFLPLAFENQKIKDYDSFFGSPDLGWIRWSDLISDIAAANPDVAITVWSNEDTPTMWPTIMKEVAGLDAQEKLAGDLDVMAKIMAPEGVTRLQSYLAERPDLNEQQIRRVKSKFLEKYYLPRAVDMEIHLPGWSDEFVQDLTERYENDLEVIEAMPGVNFICP
jgi:hypothetical protein